jgi:putative transposase
MDERLRFVARLLEGEKMAPLCAEFGISRKTGYKIFDRYKDCGVTAFTDRSRRPYRQANRLPAPIEATIVRLKREYPGWGAPKIREKLRQRVTPPLLPAISTVHAVLDRHGLVHRRRRRRHAPAGTTLSAHGAECAVVRRLQRRVHARQSPLLLSADDHRLRQPVPAHL